MNLTSVLLLGTLLSTPRPAPANPPLNIATHTVYEVVFTGPAQTPADTPARDITLDVTFTPAPGVAATALTLPGFWDGDGQGGTTGNVFRVRFRPTAPGLWTLTRTASNHPALSGQHEGLALTALPSTHPGPWSPDPATGGRWYHRADGSHPYIIGNTLYDFVSEHAKDGTPNGATIEQDVATTARYFNKLRFTVVNDLYAHPTIRTFFDATGTGTNDGDHSLRPNPAWFARVDRAVHAAQSADLIADLILNGVDSRLGRNSLKAGANQGDATPWLRYLAARYGSYPHVWFCLTNEFNTKKPTFTPAEISALGQTLRRFLAYPTPLSVHGDTGNWKPALNTTPAWHDHAITQLKNYTLAGQARHLRRNFALAGSDRPVFNDEAAYEGAGDRVSEVQAITALLGVFAGGGYPSTGYKNAKPIGQYFWGHFDPAEHTSADNLRWLRTQIDTLPFWRLSPQPDLAPFTAAPPGSVVLAEPDWHYLLFTPAGPASEFTLTLPTATTWHHTRWDPLAQTATEQPTITGGTLTLAVPASSGPLVHVLRRTEATGSPARPLILRPLAPDEAPASTPITDLRPFTAQAGRCVIEAEHAQHRAPNGDQFSWTDTPLPGAGNHLALSLPDAGTLAPENEAASLDFTFQADQARPLQLWIRWRPAARHSPAPLFVALDSVRLRGRRGSAPHFVPSAPADPEGWVWSRFEETLPITATGTHTLTLLRREDGLVLDRLILTTDQDFVPSGPGPSPSPRL